MKPFLFVHQLGLICSFNKVSLMSDSELTKYVGRAVRALIFKARTASPTENNVA